MISAFESSLSKDMRPGIKPPPIGKSQYEKVGWETPMDLNSEEITEQAKQTSGRLNSHFLTGETQQIQTYGLKRERHIVFDKDSRKSSWDSRQLEEPNAIQLQSKETESIAKHEWKPQEDLVRMTTVEAATIKHIVFDKDSRKSSWDSGQLEEPSATQFQSKETESIAKHEWKPHEDLVRMIAVEAATKKHIVFDKDLRKLSRDFGQLEGPRATQCQSKETELIAKHEWKPQEDLVRMTAAKAPITKHIEFDKDSKKSSRDSGQVEDSSATQYQSKETESIEKHEWNSREDSVRMTLVEAATAKHIVFDKDSRKSSWDSGQLVEPSATQFQSKGTETIAKHEWNSQEDSERMTAVEVATAKHVVFDKDSRKSSWHSWQLEEPSATQFQSEETESIAKHEWNSQEDLVRMTDVEATTAKHVVFDKDSRKSSGDSGQFEEPSVAQFQSKETESIANPEWKSQEDLVRMNVVEAATVMHIVGKDFRKSSLHSGKLEESSATQFQSKETELIAKRGWNSQEDLERMTAVEAATTKDVVFDKDSRKSSWDSGQLEEPSTTQFQSKETESTAKHKWISLEDLMRKTAIEVATVSGNTHEERSGLNQPRILLVNQEDSSGTAIMEGCGSGIRSSNSHEVNTQGLSEDKLKSAALCENKHSSSESSGAWIFQDHARSLCVTTGRKRVMELVEGCGIQERTHEGKKSFSLPSNVEKPSMKFGNYTKEKKGDKTPHELRKLRRESSAEVETSNGPLGQVIKVTIMVAFGALVLLTRQRKPS